MDRREFLGHSAAAAAGSCMLTTFGAAPAMAQAVRSSRTQPADMLDQHYPFVLPPLGYAPDAVQPAVDARTMSLHHAGHHATYVANLNRALAPHADVHASTLRALLSGLTALPDRVRTVVRNDGGGHANHGQFWPLLALRDATGPGEALRAARTISTP